MHQVIDRLFGFFLLATFLGCGQHSGALVPSPAEEPLYLVEIVGGEVQAQRPDGLPWDGQQESQSRALSLVTPLGSISVTLATAHQDSSVDHTAPDVAAMLHFGNRTIDAPPSANSFSPYWHYSFLFDPQIDIADNATVELYDDDADAPQSLGVRSVQMVDLLRQTETELGPFGSVLSFKIKVTPASPNDFPPFELGAVEVPASSQTWINTGLTLTSGMHVALTAEGRIRLSRLSTKQWSPLGVNDPRLNDRWQSMNLEGFEQVPHGALVACIVDPRSGAVMQRLAIREGLLLRVDGSGVLLLGINDRDVGNNAGGFRVWVGGSVRMPIERVPRPHLTAADAAR